MLPALDARGFLPAGVHVATLDEIEAAFATNSSRANLLRELRRFIKDHLANLASGLNVYLAGSFFSDKVAPGDIDCVVEIPFVSIPQYVALLNLFNDGRTNTGSSKGWIWDTYRVDAFPSLIGSPGTNDFVAFFQYVGVKSASMKSLSPTDRRGIVKVEQWILG